MVISKSEPHKKGIPPLAGGSSVAGCVESGPATIKRRRSNVRSERTIEKILAATEEIILTSGAERISILNVCHAADIARGTFYRYFASQNELLDAFSQHTRESFHQDLFEAIGSIPDPDARFEAFIEHLNVYLASGKALRLLLVAPEYALTFFRRIFQDSVARFQSVLGIIFDAWEERLQVELDRDLLCEMLIRYLLSEMLVMTDTDRKALARRIGRFALALAGAAAVPQRSRPSLLPNGTTPTPDEVTP